MSPRKTPTVVGAIVAVGILIGTACGCDAAPTTTPSSTTVTDTVPAHRANGPFDPCNGAADAAIAAAGYDPSTRKTIAKDADGTPATTCMYTTATGEVLVSLPWPCRIRTNTH